MKRFSQNNLTLAYRQEGQGKSRLIFLHGLCGSKDLWSEQFAFFKATHEVIAVDLLGHGESSAVPPAHFISENVSLLKSFLTDLPPCPTFIFAHSLAGQIMNEVLDDKLSLAGAIFVDSPCIHSKEMLEAYNSYKSRIPNSPDPKKMIKEWFEAFVTEKASPSLRARIVDEAQRISPQWMAEVLGGLHHPHKIKTSTPILIAEGMQYHPPGNPLSWTEFYPDAQVWRYPDKGHFYFLEDAGPFNKAVQNFIDKISPKE